MSRPLLDKNEFAQVKKAIFAYLSRHESITNREIRALTNTGINEATNFFNKMVEQGCLRRVGKGAGTKYVLQNRG